MGRIQVFSELFEPMSRPGANLSIRYNVTRNIPPCFSGKMQIGSFPLLRRASDKVLLEQSNLLGVLPVCDGGQAHTPSCRRHEDAAPRGGMLRPNSPRLSYPGGVSGASFVLLPLPLSVSLCRSPRVHLGTSAT